MSTPPLPRRTQAIGALALGVHLLFLITAMPGLQTEASRHLHEPRNRARLERRVGPVLARLALAIVAADQALRRPLARQLVPVQRVFRIRQSWHLYADAPRRVRHLEVWADDELLYRSRDPDHAWRQPQLENRKVRPMAQTLAQKPDAYNWKGLGRFLVSQARADRPGATAVRIVSAVGEYGQAAEHLTHGRGAFAPAWALRALDEEELLRLPRPDEAAP